MHERSRLDHSTFWRLLATMAAAVEWRWHEEVPENLRPYQGQWLRAAGIEDWNGYDFIMLDHWNHETGRYLCRYAAAPWSSWNQAFPHSGLLLLVTEAKWRSRKKGNLVHLDNNITGRGLLFWRVSIWGCYEACYAPPRTAEPRARRC